MFLSKRFYKFSKRLSGAFALHEVFANKEAVEASQT